MSVVFFQTWIKCCEVRNAEAYSGKKKKKRLDLETSISFSFPQHRLKYLTQCPPSIRYNHRPRISQKQPCRNCCRKTRSDQCYRSPDEASFPHIKACLLACNIEFSQSSFPNGQERGKNNKKDSSSWTIAYTPATAHLSTPWVILTKTGLHWYSSAG